MSAHGGSTSRRNWSLEETQMAFALYYVLPPSECDDTGDDVQHLARCIHRSPNSVALKIWNIAANDPNRIALGKVGMSHGSKLDKEVWQRYAESPDSFLGECLSLLFHTFEEESHGMQDAQAAPSLLTEAEQEAVLGDEREATVMERVHQQYFRKSLMSNYHNKCCMTGISLKQLLVASHIKPWVASSAVEKTAASNGLLLNAFHDKAFDRGLITIDDDYRIRVAESEVPHTEANEFWLYQFEGQKIDLPTICLPSHEFIEYHHKHVFLGAA